MEDKKRRLAIELFMETYPTEEEYNLFIMELDKKPAFIKEPFGLPLELSPKDKYKTIDEQGSLLDAIRAKDKEKIKDLEQRAKKGEIIRIM